MEINAYLTWQPLVNADQVAEEACQQILIAANQAIQTRGHFRIVLAGGHTPKLTYSLLAKVNTNWSKWHIYYGDERCLPETDEERNSRMAAQVWLNAVTIPPPQIHPIPAQLGAIAAAQHYTEIIQPILPFDLVLLGLGEDGHTASLFPNQVHSPHELVHPIFNAPKPPAERVTLSIAALSQTWELIFLITGRNKREAVTAWQRGDNLPVAQIRAYGNTTVLLEQAAMISPIM
ncbi:MAG: 6-phosphogluconolactonase [Thioploca sp.]|nr:6-phosphogluconolactonase [Thioploca sp.]